MRECQAIAQFSDGEWAVLEGSRGAWRGLEPGPDGIVTRYSEEVLGELQVRQTPVFGARLRLRWPGRWSGIENMPDVDG